MAATTLSRCDHALHLWGDALQRWSQHEEVVLDADMYEEGVAGCEGLDVEEGAVFVMLELDVVGYLDRTAETRHVWHPVHLLSRSIRWLPGALQATKDQFSCIGVCIPRACVDYEGRGVGYSLRRIVVESVVKRVMEPLEGRQSLPFLPTAYSLHALKPGVDFGICPRFCRQSLRTAGIRGEIWKQARAHFANTSSCLFSSRLPLVRQVSATSSGSVTASRAAHWLRKQRDDAAAAGYCFFSILTGPAYVPGILVLYHSLLRVRSRYPFCVAITPNVAISVSHLLMDLGIRVLRLQDPGPVPSGTPRPDSAKIAWVVANAKLDLFNLGPKGYKKIVILDGDLLVLRNIDDLFDRPAGSCFRPGVAGHEFNIGVYVLETDDVMYRFLRSALEDDLRLGGDPTGVDQRVLYEKSGGASVYEARPHLHLEERYNAFAEQLDVIVRKRKLELPWLLRWGPGPTANSLDSWRCNHGGFDHCCRMDSAGTLSPRLTGGDGFDESACMEGELDHRGCCQDEILERQSRHIRVTHFVLKKPWRATNISAIHNEGRALGIEARRAYALWFEAAEEADTQFVQLFRALDERGSEARDLLAAGDGV